MSNRFQDEFPSLDWQIAPPPLGPDAAEVYARRARRARNEVVHQALVSGAGWAGTAASGLADSVARFARQAAAFVRCAGYGAAKRAPQRAGSAGGCG